MSLLKNRDRQLDHRFETCLEKAWVACAAFLMSRIQCGVELGGVLKVGEDGREAFDDVTQAPVLQRLHLSHQALLELQKLKPCGLGKDQLNIIAEAEQLFAVKTTNLLTKNTQGLGFR